MPRKPIRERVERGLYRADGTYYACATPRGSRQAVWRTLGRIGLMEARRRRDDFVAEVHRDATLETARRATFQQAADRWMAEQRDRCATETLAPNTLTKYETALRLHILPSLGSRQLRAIGPDELIAWHRHLAARGYAPDTVRTYWMALRLVLAYAVRYRLLPDNPADQLLPNERPSTGAGRKRFLSKDEMRRLLAAAPPRYRVALATGLFSGLRVAEVLGLVWSNVDFAKDELHVRAQMGRDGKRKRLKTGAALRDVILMPQLALELKRHRLASSASDEGDLVFATRLGTTIGTRNLSGRGMERARDSAGMPGVTFHTLRHTFASLLIAQGHDPVFVSRQLGHASPTITLNTYAHLFDNARHAQAARNQLDDEYRDVLTDTAT